MYILLILYRIIVLPFVSVIENLYFYYSVSKKERIKAKDRLKHIKQRLKRNIMTALQEMQELKYVPDRQLLYNLTNNYIPFPLIVIIRNGGDCSVLARFYKWLCQKQGIKAELYIMWDSAVKGFYNKLQTMHVFSVSKNENYYSSVNATMIIKNDTKENIINQIKTCDYYIFGSEYKYKNPVVKRWI